MWDVFTESGNISNKTKAPKGAFVILPQQGHKPSRGAGAASAVLTND